MRGPCGEWMRSCGRGWTWSGRLGAGGGWRGGIAFGLWVLTLLGGGGGWHAQGAPARRFEATTPREARRWQEESRSVLYRVMMGGDRPRRGELRPEVLRRIEVSAGGYALEEVRLQSLADRRVHAWLAVPLGGRRRVGGVLAVHGHGGSGEEVVRGLGLYWYGRALAEMGYVVIAPDVGQHELQHGDWTLMGERVWDALRCVDYLETRPEVDGGRLAVAGLSLGGETAMYVAALDERLRAVSSSGWLTTVANMRTGHCACWDFPGLEENFDFEDIFACVAPRPLVLELGERERAPGGFPVAIGRGAMVGIERAYRVFGVADAAQLTVHGGGHVFVGRDFWGPLRRTLGVAWPWAGEREGRGAGEWLRRGEVARRCLMRAHGVLEGWWRTRDAGTGLFPRRLDQPVWAPADNAADMLPFLAITAHRLDRGREPSVLGVLGVERALTTRHAGLPDWLTLTNRAFTYADTNLARLIFGAAEYCKDGLVPMTEAMGSGVWTERWEELMAAIFAVAPVASAHGALPADDSEVNGDILQALARLHGVTRDEKYLQWAERIGDAYCFEVLPGNGGLPPHRWDFAGHRVFKDTLNLNDHGNELLGGLAELLVCVQRYRPVKAARYEPVVRALFHRLLERARNEDGLWYNLLEASTGRVLDTATPDTWGYALAAMHTVGVATGDAVLLEAVARALRGLDRPRYLHWGDADAYADALEGALLALNRVREPEGFRWLERMMPLFLGKQREDGIVEGWYGDGNYARTALMVAQYCSQGAGCDPWRDDVRLGGVEEDGVLRLALAAERAWSGVVRLDTARHREHVGLNVNYARLNEFPQWYVVAPEARYAVRVGGEGRRYYRGAELARGLPVRVAAGEVIELQVAPAVE